MEENKYYVYMHVKLDTGEPFYVGKGKGNRSSSKNGRSNAWQKTVNKHGFYIIFLENHLTFEDSNLKEIYWIDRIGRRDLGKGPLVNFTDGGEGVKNLNEKIKEKIRIANTGYKHSDESKQKMRTWHIGKVLTQEHKDKIRIANTGQKRSDDVKEKMKEVYQNNKHLKTYPIGVDHHFFGKQHSEYTKKLISDKKTGIKYIDRESKQNKIVLDLYTGIFYNTLTEASKISGINRTTLSRICISKNKRYIYAN